MQTFKIANKLISNNSKTFIIAEIGLAHMGSLNIAHSFIDAAAKFGADAVKFQMHIASEESTVDEKFRIKFLLNTNQDMNTGKKHPLKMRNGMKS